MEVGGAGRGVAAPVALRPFPPLLPFPFGLPPLFPASQASLLASLRGASALRPFGGFSLPPFCAAPPAFCLPPLPPLPPLPLPQPPAEPKTSPREPERRPSPEATRKRKRERRRAAGSSAWSGCPVCGKAFSRHWLLQGHLRTHTGEKPFRCSVCQKGFADKSNLRAHAQTHSGLKPHRCALCGKAFALKSYLSKHQEATCHPHSTALPPTTPHALPHTPSPTRLRPLLAKLEPDS